MPDIEPQVADQTLEPPYVACSVCIANFNGENSIDWCLSSVLEQTTDFAFEVIVHDDRSTDGSVSIIRSRYPDVQLIESASTTGFCVSNNRMVERAVGQYVLLLNNDAALRPGALQALYDASVEGGGRKAGRGQGHAEDIDILSLPQWDASTGELIDRGIRPDFFLNAVPNVEPSDASVGAVHGACLWIARDLWNGIGGFPAWFESVAEDLYLCCCVRLRGGQVRVIESSAYDHLVGVSFGGGKVENGRLRTTRKRRALSERNRLFTMLACYPWPWLWILFPLHLVFLLIEGVLVSLLLRDIRLWRQIYWAAFIGTWRERRLIFQLRRSTQATRTVSGRHFFRPFRKFHRKLSALLTHGLPEVS